NRPRSRGAPGATRTPDLRIRSPTLYPAELRARSAGRSIHKRSGRRKRFSQAEDELQIGALERGEESAHTRHALQPGALAAAEQPQRGRRGDVPLQRAVEEVVRVRGLAR